MNKVDSSKVSVTIRGQLVYILFVWAVSLPWLEGFQNNLAKVFVMIRCVARMNQVYSLKVNVTL